MKKTPSALPNPSTPDFLGSLTSRAREADGQPPFSDQALVELHAGTRELVTIGLDAAAIVSPAEAEFVVAPESRRRGIGTQLLESILATAQPGFRIWAHGDHPGARALARSHGLTAMRTLLQLRAEVPQPSSAHPPVEARAVDHFRVGDDVNWLALNARAFAFHPEQGSVDQSDLDALKSQQWFSADDFLLLRDRDAILGYCWLKIDDGIGEFYVVGVDPDRQGEGLGRALMEAGFARLTTRGIQTAALYVEADNLPAVQLYRSLGFVNHSIDIQYARS